MSIAPWESESAAGFEFEWGFSIADRSTTAVFVSGKQSEEPHAYDPTRNARNLQIMPTCAANQRAPSRVPLVCALLICGGLLYLFGRTLPLAVSPPKGHDDDSEAASLFSNASITESDSNMGFLFLTGFVLSSFPTRRRGASLHNLISDNVLFDRTRLPRGAF